MSIVKLPIINYFSTDCFLTVIQLTYSNKKALREWYPKRAFLCLKTVQATSTIANVCCLI